MRESYAENLTTVMIHIDRLVDENVEEASELLLLAGEAERYLTAHHWCKKVLNLYFDRGFSQVAVFYAEIVAAGGAPPTQWVIVGDLPPAYLDTIYCENGAEALNAYVYWRKEWIAAVREGRSTHEIMPVLVRESYRPIDPTPEYVDLLERRVKFVEKELLSQWVDEIRPS